jgi:toxin YoeB
MALLAKHSPKFQEDLEFFSFARAKLVKKIRRMVDAILNNPREGIGHPEQLKHKAGELWSRRVDEKHRLVYRVDDECVEFLSCRGHYGDR